VLIIQRVIAVNALSLVCALVANICLLMHIRHCLAFSVAQPIVIIGWYISSLSLVTLLVLIVYGLHRPDPNYYYTLTQSYYYGAIAAVLYFILSSLLILTMLGAHKGHCQRGFKLTTSQRTLMLQTVGFLVYLLAGSAVYARVENWRFTDAVYWSDTTLLTIGLGKPAPQTHLGRSLLFPYAIGGILLLGVVIGSIRSLVIESSRKKLASRLMEKTRQYLAKRVAERKWLPNFLTRHASPPEEDDEVRHKHEFYAMRRVRRIIDAEHRWLSLFASGASIMMLWCLGAAVFWKSESNQGWTYFQALYFSYTSLLTIGYGDLNPVSSWGKSFFVFWSLPAVPTMTIFISNLKDTVIYNIRKFTVFAGELTISPGEETITNRLKRLVLKPSDSDADGGQSLTRDLRHQVQEARENPQMERVGGIMGAGELHTVQGSPKRSDIVAENIHQYLYLLIHEVRKMLEHVKSSSPREFKYDEWTYCLKLVGEEESITHFSQDVPAGEASPRKRHRESNQRRRSRRKWSWIGPRSPLIGDRTEAEWLLDALFDRLENELSRLAGSCYHNRRGDSGCHREPVGNSH
jgi:potassium channel subfamily K, other eukaryote